MKLSIQERKQIKLFARKLIEARDSKFAEYEVKKDKVIATVSAQKGSAFTKLADEWRKFEKLEKELADRKRQLNTELQAAKTTEDELKDKIREKVSGIFDDSEQAMSLAVHCLNSSFTLSQMTQENQPQTVARKGDLIDTDYKKVVELLVEQNQDLQAVVSNLIKQCSTVASEDIIKPGQKRRVRISTAESLMKEGWWDNVVNIYNKISVTIRKYFSRLISRKKQIDQSLMLLKGK